MKERLQAQGAPEHGVDRLASLAARRAPAPAKDAEAELREALLAGRARLRSAASKRSFLLMSGGALAAAALAALVLRRPPPEPPLTSRAEPAPAPAPSPAPPLAPSAPPLVEAPPAIFALGARDRAHVMPGSDLTLEERDRGRTVLRLREGAALFDVGPHAAGGLGAEPPTRSAGGARSFEILTPDARVRVRGTVFAVTVRGARTRVEVFEGRVEVQDERGQRTLAAGESYAVAGAGPTPPELSSRGMDAARERAASAAAPRPVAPAPGVELAELRAMCDRGEFAEALEAMRGRTPPRAERGDWALLEGDAHRALGHAGEAASAYERAASALTPSRAALAGFLAAGQNERSGDLGRALAALERAHAAERGSPVEERALALRASLLARLSRWDEARTSARAYLAGFPGGEARGRMQALLEPAAAP